MRTVQLEHSWRTLLEDQFEQPYMRQLREFLLDEKRAGHQVFPAGKNMFTALNLVPLERAKVVIIGQDPYHGPGQAHGLSFSVLSGVPLPPSLRNIFTEIESDVGCTSLVTAGSGDLSLWAEQGVLLLNSVLSVRARSAGSHQGQGWEQFTDVLVQRLAAERAGLVFLLWGSYAQKKAAIVDNARHCLLKAPHPSPLSAHRGFFGCRHFSQTNQYLESQGHTPIDWARLR
ncbi:MAG: uracil-DNA glycosylase [Candidatus Azotimanducaceae bacterium]